MAQKKKKNRWVRRGKKGLLKMKTREKEGRMEIRGKSQETQERQTRRKKESKVG